MDHVGPASSCQDAGCNGVIKWKDGTPFVFESWMAGIDYDQSLLLALSSQGQIMKVVISGERGNLCQCEKRERYFVIVIFRPG